MAAGAVLRKLYDTPVAISRKGRIDLVTEADVAAEKTILEILRRSHPKVAILAEESANTWSSPPTGPVWIIDPLDGTTNFAHAFPWFAVSIGYFEAGIGQVVVIFNPIQEEFFRGGRLDGFWEINLKPWDTAAGVLLLEEAGGRISDFAGGPHSPFLAEIVASNGLIHEEMLAVIKEQHR